jgi:PPOX class probable F420-dependent enzyme
VDDAEARRRFAEARVARMATVTPDGRPHVVPIVFAMQDDLVFSIVDAKPKRSLQLQRLANIASNSNVALLVDHYDEDWNSLWWVRADGTARVVEDGPELDHAVELLRAKYEQYATWSEPVGAAVVIRIERLRSWSLTGE